MTPVQHKDDGGAAIDRELDDLPPEMRWREWRDRVEIVLFAAAAPVSAEILARVVGGGCSVEQLVRDLQESLIGRPYEVVRVAGGWQFRSRAVYGAVIRAARPPMRSLPAVTKRDAVVLATIAYHQPVTRAALGRILGREVGREPIARLREAGVIASGPRSPSQGAPVTLVTTTAFLELFGLQSLADLPSLDELQEAGLISGRDVTSTLGMPLPPAED